MTGSISHQAISSQVKACVALENLMHPDKVGLPLLLANGEALDSAVRTTLLHVAAELGNRATDISQSDSQTTIVLVWGSPTQRYLIEQTATALLLRQCFSTIAPRLAEHYGKLADSLSAQLATAGADGVRIKDCQF